MSPVPRWFADLPLDFSRVETREIEQLLQSQYDDWWLIKELLGNSGLSAGDFTASKPPRYLLRDVLIGARNAGRLERLLAEVLADDRRHAIHADLRRLTAGYEAELRAAVHDNRPSLATLRRIPFAGTVWPSGKAAPIEAASGFEQVINEAAGFADIAAFRSGMTEAEVRVARIELGGHARGTGFLIGADLLLTNFHVIHALMSVTIPASGYALARFDHMAKADGASVRQGRAVPFSDDWLVAHNEHAPVAQELSADGPPQGGLDYALVRLAQPVGAQPLGPAPPEPASSEPAAQGAAGDVRGFYRLPTMVHAFLSDEPLLIVGHPNRRPMQLSFASPSGAQLTKHENRVRYNTNTEGGSSGSPVFDKSWSPVALHHAAGPDEADSAFVQSDAPFNQGIPLSLISADLRAKLSADPASLQALGLTAPP